MNGQDAIEIEITDDGKIKTSVPGSISPANHSNAESFFRYLATMTDGNVSRTKLKEAHSHHAERESVREGGKA